MSGLVWIGYGNGSFGTFRSPVLRLTCPVRRRRTERGGLDQALFCKLAKALCLRLKSGSAKDFARLIDVLFLHDFLPSRDAF